MAHRIVTSEELRNVSFPESESGYPSHDVDIVISACADTIEELEAQVIQLHNALAMARAESAPMELASAGDDEDVIAQWLTTLDPLDIDREVQKTIAESIVESTMAASHIRSEARERVKSLIDAVANEVQKLMGVVKDSRSSVAAAQNLPTALVEWQGEFAVHIGTLLEQLQLPWTVQVSQLAKILTHMAENGPDYVDPVIQQQEKRPPSSSAAAIKRRLINQSDEDEEEISNSSSKWTV